MRQRREAVEKILSEAGGKICLGARMVTQEEYAQMQESLPTDFVRSSQARATYLVAPPSLPSPFAVVPGARARRRITGRYVGLAS